MEPRKSPTTPPSSFLREPFLVVRGTTVHGNFAGQDRPAPRLRGNSSQPRVDSRGWWPERWVASLMIYEESATKPHHRTQNPRKQHTPTHGSHEFLPHEQDYVACAVLHHRDPQPCTQYALTCCFCDNFPQTLQGNPCPAVQGTAAPPPAHRMGAIPPEVPQGVPLAGAQARAPSNPHLLSRQPCARNWRISDLAVQCAEGPGRHRRCTPGAP